MSNVMLSGVILFVAACAAPPATQPPAAAPSATLFEGARLITGDEAPPIEDSAFVVQDGKFTNLLSDLQRFAYHGVTAVLSMGADRREIAWPYTGLRRMELPHRDGKHGEGRISRVYLRGAQIDRSTLRTQLKGGPAAATRPTTH